MGSNPTRRTTSVTSILDSAMHDITSIIAQKLKTNTLKMPSLPENALKIRRMAGDPNVSLRDLTNLISLDANISAQLIRLAQTLRYSNPGCTITSLANAINRIGMQGTINLVLAMSILQGYKFKSRVLHEACRRDGEWSKQICRYALTIHQAKTSKLSQADADFISLACMFINIGALPLYGELDSFAISTGQEYTKDEVAKWALQLRVPLGKLLLQTWNFDPKFFKTLTLNANDPEYSEDMKSVAQAVEFLTTAEENLIAPIPRDVGDCFAPMSEGNFFDALSEWLISKGIQPA